jgi:NADPH:quinone reductase-like Zn-dependent oxidoreductase
MLRVRGNIMKAVFIERFGGPEVLQYGDVPDPIAGPGEVLVDVVAASINGADWKVRAGQYAQAKFPLVLGRDFSGIVAATGAGVDDLKIGDAVFGVLEGGREGAYAEKLAIKAAIIAKKPDPLSHVDAAALALTGLTAIVSVETTLKLQRGETILIQGGAGGVASFAIQLAKHIGARVITTTSTANVGYVRGLGADQVIDYTAQDFTRVVSGCDAVFDTVGGEVAEKSFAVHKPGGRAAFIASGAQAPKPDRADVTSLRPAVGRARAPLERIAQLVAAGVVRPPEIKLYRLSEAAEAHRVSEGRHFRGKLVFEVR